MKYNLDLTFREIFNDDPKAFLEQVIDIQNFQAKRKKSENWAGRLQLIDVSDVPNLTDQADAK
jgi:hypothetical protein